MIFSSKINIFYTSILVFVLGPINKYTDINLQKIINITLRFLSENKKRDSFKQILYLVIAFLILKNFTYIIKTYI